MKDMQKKDLRKQTLVLREKIKDKAILSGKICQNIKNSYEYLKARTILGFYPFGDEPDIIELLDDTGKKWFLPRVEGDVIFFYEYNKLTWLHPNKWGILEPAGGNKLTDFSAVDLAIVPALAVGKNGYRLGYGGGYYDKFLPSLPKNCLKICPLYSELLLDDIFHEDFDVRIDKVFTEEGFLQF